MWKAAFSGRSETGSVSGRSSLARKKSSGSSRKPEEEGRRSGRSSRGSVYGDGDRAPPYAAAPSSRHGEPRSLTESALRTLNDDDGEWEDEDRDARSERKSVRSDGKRRRRKSEKERSRSRSRDKEERRRTSSRKDLETSRGKSRQKDVGTERALPEMGSMQQFPGQYSGGMIGPAGVQEPMMSGAIPTPTPNNQFGLSRADSYGAAADYYLDEGQSVANQPGFRKNSPNMLVNPDLDHLMTPTAQAQPAQDTGHGSAADFYSGKVSPVLSAEPQPMTPSKPSSSSRPSRPGKTNSFGTAATAAVAGAGIGAAASSFSQSQNYTSSTSYQQNSTGSTQSYARPNGQSSMPMPTTPGCSNAYYGPPPSQGQSSGTSGKQSSHYNAGLYAAGAAAAGLAAYEMHEHHENQHGANTASRPPLTNNSYGRPPSYGQQPYAGGSMMQQHQHYHEHKGPMTRLKDGLLNLISSEEDTIKMEMYTEYIGVCKHCFDPRSSPYDAPRRHHYHRTNSRDSFEDLRKRRSLDKMRRSSREQLARTSSTRVDKDSRYYNDRRKSSSKTELVGAGIAAAGVAAGANALFNSDRRNFDDTYSIKSGHRAGSAVRQSSRSSSRERRRRSSYGVVGRDGTDEYVTVRTKDGRVERRRRASSRSRSGDRRSTLTGAAAGAALGASAISAAGHSRRSREHSPNGTFVRRRRSRSSSSSGSQGGGLFGFFSPPRRKRRGSRSERRKKQNGFFTFSNDSAVSTDSELAFGVDTTDLPLRRKSSMKSTGRRRRSDEHIAATVAGIGATAAALAAAQNGHRIGKRSSRPELGPGWQAKQRQIARKLGKTAESDDEWEDELPSDVNDATSGSDLAFGSDYEHKLARRQSRESVGSQSSGAGGLSAWGWRWGGKDKKKQRRVPQQPPSYPPRPEASGLGSAVTGAALGAGTGAALGSEQRPSRPESTYTSASSIPQQPMQYVDPRPVSDSGSLPRSRHASMPGAWDDAPYTARPGPGPIVQPRPVAPTRPSFTQNDHDFDAPRPPPRRTQSSPVQSSFVKDAAVIGAAALGTAAVIAAQGRKPKDVRFGFTEEQERRHEEERRVEQQKADEERRRADRARALKEEAERYTREQDMLRRRAEENQRIAEEKVRRQRAEEEEKRRVAEAEERSRRAVDREAQEQAEMERQRVEREEARRKEREERDRREREEARLTEEIERKKRELEDRGRRESKTSSRRQSLPKEDKTSSSDVSWGAVAAGAAVAGVGAYALAEHERSKEQERDSNASRTSRGREAAAYKEFKPPAEPVAAALPDEALYDPEYFKRQRSKSPVEYARGVEKLARRAAGKVVSANSVLKDQEQYYSEPAQSQAEFFAPKEILAQRAEGKTKVADPIGDNTVQVYNAADLKMKEQFATDWGGTFAKPHAKAPRGVPRLDLITPTPPPEAMSRTRRATSPVSRSTDEPQAEARTRKSSRSRSISWGADQTHVYEVRTPEPHIEKDSYVDSHDLPSAGATAAGIAAAGVAAAALNEVVVERASSSGQAEAKHYRVDDLVQEAKQSSHRNGVEPDSEGISRDSQVPPSYRQPFYESVSDIGIFPLDSPGTEGAPPVQGFVEGELDEPTPAEEKAPHIPGGFDDDEVESRPSARDTPTIVPVGEPTEPQALKSKPSVELAPVEAEAASFDPPLSKKDKKKRDKAAKKSTASDDFGPATEIEPSVVPAVTETPTQPEDHLDSYMSKKDKKKRDKAAKRAATLDDFTTPPAVPAEVPDEPEDDPDMFLSKKDKKKRDKAAKRSATLDDSTFGLPSPEPPVSDPIEQPVAEPEDETDFSVSKKDKKKRDKALKRAMSEDQVTSSPPAEPEDPMQESTTSLRDAEPELEPAWEPPLSKKEKKKREKEARKVGFADVAESLMTAGGIAAVAGVAAASSDDWSEPSSSKKGKEGKKSREIERDPRDIEPSFVALPEETASEKAERDAPVMPGAWDSNDKVKDSTPPIEAVDPFQFQVHDEATALNTQEVDPSAEFADVKTSKKSKRDSLKFHEPAVASPLKTEVPFAYYVADTAAGADATPSKSSEGRNGYHISPETARTTVADQFAGPAGDRTDDLRSTVSAPAEDRRRSKNGAEDDTRYYDEPESYDDGKSVAVSEPADYESARKSKRRSRHEDDDTASVRSSRSRREPSEPSSKDKKSGFFGGLFSRKSSDAPSKYDGAPLSRQSTRESKDDDAEHRRRKRRSASEYGDDDDTRSIASESSRKHRSRPERNDDRERRRSGRYGEDDYDVRNGDDRHRHHHRRRTNESVRSDSREPSSHRHHHRRRTDDYTQDEDQSFLGMRVEDMPPLPDSPIEPLDSVTNQGEQGHGTLVSTEPDAHPATREVADTSDTARPEQSAEYPFPAVKTPAEAHEVSATTTQTSFADDVTSLPALPASRPSSPTALQDEDLSQRPAISQRPVSTTAVPLRFPFGHQPPTPITRMERAASFAGTVPNSPATPGSSQKRQGRPLSTEIRPFYLLESTRKIPEVEDQLPSLPSSKPSSRASSMVGSDEYESALEDFGSPQRTRRLTIDTQQANREWQDDDYLDSQQTTPRATQRPELVTEKPPRQEPQFYTWEDWAQEERMHDAETGPAEAASSYEQPVTPQQVLDHAPSEEMDNEQYPALPLSRPESRTADRTDSFAPAGVSHDEELPTLPPSRPESPTAGEADSDAAKGVLAAAALGAAAGVAYHALKSGDGPTTASENDVKSPPVDTTVSNPHSPSRDVEADHGEPIEEITTPFTFTTSSTKKGKKGDKAKKAAEASLEKDEAEVEVPKTRPPLVARDINGFLDEESVMEEGRTSGPVASSEQPQTPRPSNELDSFVQLENQLEEGSGSADARPATEVDVAPESRRESVDDFFQAEERMEAGDVGNEGGGNIERGLSEQSDIQPAVQTDEKLSPQPSTTEHIAGDASASTEPPAGEVPPVDDLASQPENLVLPESPIDVDEFMEAEERLEAREPQSLMQEPTMIESNDGVVLKDIEQAAVGDTEKSDVVTNTTTTQSLEHGVGPASAARPEPQRKLSKKEKRKQKAAASFAWDEPTEPEPEPEMLAVADEQQEPVDTSSAALPESVNVDDAKSTNARDALVVPSNTGDLASSADALPDDAEPPANQIVPSSFSRKLSKKEKRKQKAGTSLPREESTEPEPESLLLEEGQQQSVDVPTASVPGEVSANDTEAIDAGEEAVALARTDDVIDTATPTVTEDSEQTAAAELTPAPFSRKLSKKEKKKQKAAASFAWEEPTGPVPESLPAKNEQPPITIDPATVADPAADDVETSNARDVTAGPSTTADTDVTIPILPDQNEQLVAEMQPPVLSRKLSKKEKRKQKAAASLPWDVPEEPEPQSIEGDRQQEDVPAKMDESGPPEVRTQDLPNITAITDEELPVDDTPADLPKPSETLDSVAADITSSRKTSKKDKRKKKAATASAWDEPGEPDAETVEEEQPRQVTDQTDITPEHDQSTSSDPSDIREVPDRSAETTISAAPHSEDATPALLGTSNTPDDSAPEAPLFSRRLSRKDKKKKKTAASLALDEPSEADTPTEPTEPSRGIEELPVDDPEVATIAAEDEVKVPVEQTPKEVASTADPVPDEVSQPALSSSDEPPAPSEDFSKPLISRKLSKKEKKKQKGAAKSPWTDDPVTTEQPAGAELDSSDAQETVAPEPVASIAEQPLEGAVAAGSIRLDESEDLAAETSRSTPPRKLSKKEKRKQKSAQVLDWDEPPQAEQAPDASDDDPKPPEATGATESSTDRLQEVESKASPGMPFVTKALSPPSATLAGSDETIDAGPMPSPKASPSAVTSTDVATVQTSLDRTGSSAEKLLLQNLEDPPKEESSVDQVSKEAPDEAVLPVQTAVEEAPILQPVGDDPWEESPSLSRKKSKKDKKKQRQEAEPESEDVSNEVQATGLEGHSTVGEENLLDATTTSRNVAELDTPAPDSLDDDVTQSETGIIAHEPEQVPLPAGDDHDLAVDEAEQIPLPADDDEESDVVEVPVNSARATAVVDAIQHDALEPSELREPGTAFNEDIKVLPEEVTALPEHEPEVVQNHTDGHEPPSNNTEMTTTGVGAEPPSGPIVPTTLEDTSAPSSRPHQEQDPSTRSEAEIVEEELPAQAVGSHSEAEVKLDSEARSEVDPDIESTEEAKAEMQPETPAEPEDEFQWAAPSKKKGKKVKKSKAVAIVEPEPAAVSSTPDAPAEPERNALSSATQVAAEPEPETAVIEPPADVVEAGDDFWSPLPTKKKKGKKGRKSGVDTPPAEQTAEVVQILPSKPSTSGDAAQEKPQDIPSSLESVEKDIEGPVEPVGPAKTSDMTVLQREAGGDAPLPSTAEPELAEALTSRRQGAPEVPDVGPIVDNVIDASMIQEDIEPAQELHDGKDDKPVDDFAAGRDIASANAPGEAHLAGNITDPVDASTSEDVIKPTSDQATTEEPEVMWSVTRSKRKDKKSKKAKNLQQESDQALEDSVTTTQSSGLQTPLDADPAESEVPRDVGEPERSTEPEPVDIWTAPSKGKRGKKSKKAVIPTPVDEDVNPEVLPSPANEDLGSLQDPGADNATDSKPADEEPADAWLAQPKGKKGKKSKKGRRETLDWTSVAEPSNETATVPASGVATNQDDIEATTRSADEPAQILGESIETTAHLPQMAEPGEESSAEVASLATSSDQLPAQEPKTVVPDPFIDPDKSTLLCSKLQLDDLNARPDLNFPDQFNASTVALPPDVDGDWMEEKPTVDTSRDMITEPTPFVPEDQTTHGTDQSLPAKEQDERDVDFSADVASGLASSGFDPAVFVNDAAFQRRSSPPGHVPEADPEEVFTTTTKKKKGKKSKRIAEVASKEPDTKTTDDSAPRDTPITEKPTADDFDATLAKTLAGTGFDAELLQQAVSSSNDVSTNEVTGDDEGFAFTTKRKKGKKARKMPRMDSDTLPTGDTEDSAASEQRQTPQPSGPELESTTALSNSLDPTDFRGPPAGMATDLPTDSRSTNDSARIADLQDVPSVAQNMSTAVEPQPDVPVNDPASHIAIAGDREMDIDEMDKAYNSFKKNKRDKKKRKGGDIKVEEAPDSEAKAVPSMPAESTPSVPSDSDMNGQVMRRATLGGHEDKPRSQPEPGSESSLDVQHASDGHDGIDNFATTVAGLSAATAAAAGLDHTLGTGTNEQPRDNVKITDYNDATLPEEPSVRSGPTSSWSFDGLKDDGEPLPESPLLGKKAHEVARDSGYQEANTPMLRHRSIERNFPDAPTLKATTSHESLSSRRSAEPLRISTDAPFDWSLNVAKGRVQDGTRNASDSLHARTASRETEDTPLDSTTKNRTSYLFQSTPETLRDIPDPATEGSPTPREQPQTSEYFRRQASTSSPEPASAMSSFGGSAPERTAFSPVPSGTLSPRAPLDPIPEENQAQKRSIADVGGIQSESAKALRRTETPQAIRARERALSPVAMPPLSTPANNGRSVSNPLSTDELIHRLPWPAVDEDHDSIGIDQALSRKHSRHVSAEHRSPSAMSNRSNFSAGHFRSPEELRSFSRTSNRSSTPTLRRISLSGDLRAASRRGDAGSAVSANRSSPKTIPFGAPPTPPSNDDDVMDGGASRSVNMSDVYQGMGDAQASQVSPTRPPSMRKRQSMHIMELESRLDQLAAENQLLHDAQQNQDVSGNVDDIRARDLQIQEKDTEICRIRAMLEPMQQEIARLNEINAGLTEANRNLVDDSNSRYAELQEEHARAHEQWQSTSRELEDVRQEHGKLSVGMREAVEAEVASRLVDKNAEIRKLREALEIASEKIRALQVQIQSSRNRDFLQTRDEDYFDGACQKLCQHVQQWVLRFSKTSDKLICRLSTEVDDEKIEARLDNAILDGSDVDKLLADRIKRRDVFMSVVMTMVWEYIFTRYLFGMEREQRQKLKALEKLLAEVGPPRAVAQWRATTLTLLSKRPAFAEQKQVDTEAVAGGIFDLLSKLLPPPPEAKSQLYASLLKVIGIAVDISIEMRIQRAEYIMLPPLQPEYDMNGDLVRKVHFNASLMNERSGMFSSNEELEETQAVVKIVLFPLVVKKGDEYGEGEEEIVVCPAQVLVHNDNGRGKKIVRVQSGAMEIDDPRRSAQSLISAQGSMAF